MRNVQKTITKIKKLLTPDDMLFRSLESFEDGGVADDEETWLALSELVLEEVPNVGKSSASTYVDVIQELSGLSPDVII